jgi:hypothetical protein
VQFCQEASQRRRSCVEQALQLAGTEKVNQPPPQFGMACMQGRGRLCWVGGPDDVHRLVCTEPGQQIGELRHVESVQRSIRGRELGEVTPTGREMKFSPVDSDGPEPVSQPAKAHPPKQRANTQVDPAHLELSVMSGNYEHIGYPGEATTAEIDDLGVHDVVGEKQFAIFHCSVWGRGVRR